MITRSSKTSDADAGYGRAPPAPTGPPAPEPKFDLWRTTHRALRGRYRLALLIAACGAAAGAWLGLSLGKRLYSASGLVRVAAVLPQVMRETDQNRPMAMFDGFIEAQRQVMTSREVLEAAMKDETWRRTMQGRPALSDDEFGASLKVETRPRSDHLRVTFVSKDAAVATAAVRSIIASYQQAFARERDRVESERTTQLTTRRASLTSELADLEKDIASAAGGRTSAELDPLYNAAAERLKKLRAALADVQCAMLVGTDGLPRTSVLPQTPAGVVAEAQLRSAAEDLARIESQLADARSRGYQPAHRTMTRLEAAVRESHERVARLTEECDNLRAMASNGTTAVSVGEREANLRKLTQTAEDEIRQLADQRDRLSDLEKRAGTLRDNLSETVTRLDALATEATLGSRLTVVLSGDRAMTAVVDTRMKTAGMGAVIGAMLPLGLFVLGVAARRRYRHATDAAADLLPRTPFVAVLPELDGDRAMSAAAAHGLHDLRVRLQPTESSGPRTYVVTSITSGDGKSSLSLALALSFAAAGFRTLLVDCDLASRQITRGLEADDTPGVIEAVAGGEPVIRRLRTGLSIMGAGKSLPEDACRLGPSATGRMLASVRDRFDVILIDGDPIMTGFTSSVLAPQADGVIFVLARGQSQTLTQQCVRRVELLNAHMACAVYNRASTEDLRTVLDKHPRYANADFRDMPERLQRFGPLVATTLSSLRLSRKEDLDLMSVDMGLAKPDDARRAGDHRSADERKPGDERAAA